MTIWEAKASALESLVTWRNSGRNLCCNSEKIDSEILALAKQIREAQPEEKK